MSERKELADLLSRAAAALEDPASIGTDVKFLIEDLLAAETNLRPPLLLEGPTVDLKFRPQAWVNDYAIAVDPEEPDTWQVSKEQFLKDFPTEDDFNNEFHLRDDLRHEGTSPKWVRDWSGPFEVELAANQPDPWGAD